MVLHHIQVSSKGGELQRTPLGDIPERRWQRSLPRGRTLHSAPGGLLWKEKCPDVQLYTNLWAVANGSLDGQGVRRRMIGKLVTKKFGEMFLD